MDLSNQDQVIPDGANAMPQQQQPHLDPNDLAAGIAQMPNNFINQISPEAMAAAGLIPDASSLMPDAATMPGMPLADPSLMMRPMMLANGNPPMPSQSNGISADEIALYDRQIRLWGMDAQAKIQRANILLITVKALANEIAKNLVLAGIGSLTILDGSPVTEADLGAQFFLAEDENLIGQNRAQAASAAIRKLNPRVKVHVDTEGVKSKGPSYFAAFDIVIATDLDPDSFNIINTATRLHGKAFYAAGCHGLYGFIFSDLIEHDYVIKREASNIDTKLKRETRTRSIIGTSTRKEGTKLIESVTKRELYSTWFLASDVANLPEEYQSKRRLRTVTPALSCLRALWEFMQLQGGRMPSNLDDIKMFTQIATRKHKALSLPSETLRPEFLRSFLQNLGMEIAPVCAILGGQLAQDVINVLGQTQQPIQNMVIFDGNTMSAPMFALHPEGEIGASLLSLGGADPMANGSAASMMMPPAGMPGLGLDTNAMGAMPQPGDLSMGVGLPHNGVPHMPMMPTHGGTGFHLQQEQEQEQPQQAPLQQQQPPPPQDSQAAGSTGQQQPAPERQPNSEG